MFSFVAISAVLFMVEGVCSLVEVLAAPGRDDERLAPQCAAYTKHDPVLGWTNAPSVRIADVFGPGLSVTINRRGLRGHELSESPAARRVVCVGDSCTFGYLVGDEESFPAQLESLNQTFQVINMGQCGFCLGQAALWYERDGPALAADLVILAFIDDDLDRMGADYMFGCPKPSFTSRAGRLIVANQPVPPRRGFSVHHLADGLQHLAIGRAVAHFSHAAEKSEVPDARQRKYETGALVVARLKHVCDGCHARLALVHLPACRVRLQGLADESSIGQAFLSVVHARDETRDVPILDLAPEFERLPVRELLPLYGPDRMHPNARGHAWIARRLNAWIQPITSSRPT